MVKVEKTGLIHAYAQCNECSWDDTISIGELNRMQKLRNRIYAHVKKTGHKVILETGNSTNYYHD